MPAADRPKPPRGLGPAGRRLWRGVVEDLDDSLELDARDAVVLEQACRLQDTMVALEDAVGSAGVVVAGSQGDRVHPGVAELRQSAHTLARLLSMIDLDDDAVPQTPTARRARRAAQARWSGHEPRRSRS